MLDYRVEIRNASGTLLYWLRPEIAALSWSYARRGGCEYAQVDLRSQIDAYAPTAFLGLDLRVIVGATTRWRGEIVGQRRSLADPEYISLDAAGPAFHRLQRIPVMSLGFPSADGGAAFDDQDPAVIASRLIDRAKPWVALTYSGASVINFGTVLTHEEISGSVADGLQFLAEVANDCEWAVDPTLVFHFRPQSALQAAYSPLTVGGNVAVLDASASSREQLNRLYIVGGSGFSGVAEPAGALAADQSQTTFDAATMVGRLTTYQQTMQTFTTTKGTCSAVELKIRPYGFSTSNILLDGDMEAVGEGNWTTLTGRSARNKYNYTRPTDDTGVKVLRITHNQTGNGVYGVYQDRAVSAGVTHDFSGWLRSSLWETPAIIELIDGSAAPYPGANTVLARMETVGTMTWEKLTATVVPSGTTLGTRVYTDNAQGYTGSDEFFCDDLKLLASWGVQIALVDATAADPTLDSAVLGAAGVPFSALAAAPTWTTVSVPMYAYLESGKEYGIRLKALGPLSDATYFDLATNLAGGYGGGALKLWNGSTWSTSGDAWFRVLLPQAIVDHGLRAEIVRHPNIRDAQTAALWGAAVLARRTAAVEQVGVRVHDAEWMAEAEIPLRRVLILGIGMTTPLNVERVAYELVDGRIDATIELGSVLPTTAAMLGQIEYRLARGEGI